ncbi:MAG: large conductance mechanosensitive channel protein MscL [Clostridia bacterium]|nr:large conductance mechanosensitive channel protein MscL [Clostridia bacterium]
MLKEFKEFASKGNAMDMAVGVIIGGAFQKIVSSLVEDIIMPTISIFTGNVDFSELVWEIGDASIKYGNFLTTIVDFLIIAFSIFIALKTANTLNKRAEAIAKGGFDKITDNKLLNKYKKKNEPVPEPTIKTCPFCFSEINAKATRCPHCTSELEKETV